MDIALLFVLYWIVPVNTQPSHTCPFPHRKVIGMPFQYISENDVRINGLSRQRERGGEAGDYCYGWSRDQSCDFGDGSVTWSVMWLLWWLGHVISHVIIVMDRSRDQSCDYRDEWNNTKERREIVKKDNERGRSTTATILCDFSIRSPERNTGVTPTVTNKQDTYLLKAFH